MSFGCLRGAFTYFRFYKDRYCAIRIVKATIGLGIQRLKNPSSFVKELMPLPMKRRAERNRSFPSRPIALRSLPLSLVSKEPRRRCERCYYNCVSHWPVCVHKSEPVLCVDYDSFPLPSCLQPEGEVALRDGSSQGAWALQHKLVGGASRIIRRQGWKEARKGVRRSKRRSRTDEGSSRQGGTGRKQVRRELGRRSKRRPRADKVSIKKEGQGGNRRGGNQGDQSDGQGVMKVVYTRQRDQEDYQKTGRKQARRELRRSERGGKRKSR